MAFDKKAYLKRLFSFDSLIRLLVLVIVVYATFLVLAHQDIVADAYGFKQYKQMQTICGGQQNLYCTCGMSKPINLTIPTYNSSS